jgi:hypothetical protein
MELSPAREGASRTSAEELPSILWNPKAYYHVHKSPPLFLILSQINSINITQSYLSKIHLSIIHSPTS